MFSWIDTYIPVKVLSTPENNTVACFIEYPKVENSHYLGVRTPKYFIIFMNPASFPALKCILPGPPKNKPKLGTWTVRPMCTCCTWRAEGSKSGINLVPGVIWGSQFKGRKLTSGWWFYITILENMSLSVGSILPNMKKCSKAPTRHMFETTKWNKSTWRSFNKSL